MPYQAMFSPCQQYRSAIYVSSAVLFNNSKESSVTKVYISVNIAVVNELESIGGSNRR